MTDVTPGQVLAQIRFAVSYQKDRFPKTLPEITAAADKLVQGRPFAEFVDDLLTPEVVETEPDALKAGIAAGGPHGE